MVKTVSRVEAARIAVALDVPTLDEAAHLAALLEGHVGVFKVGLELFRPTGPKPCTGSGRTARCSWT
jgi:orotidine-5'-phosphate decarboxylase